MRILPFIAIILLSIVACSKPSVNDVRTQLEQKINKQSNGLLKVVDLKKTNGMEKQRQFSGANYYELEWVATVELTGDCVWSDEHGAYYAYPPTSPDYIKGV